MLTCVLNPCGLAGIAAGLILFLQAGWRGWLSEQSVSAGVIASMLTGLFAWLICQGINKNRDLGRRIR